MAERSGKTASSDKWTAMQDLHCLIRSDYNRGWAVEECFEHMQGLLRTMVYDNYRVLIRTSFQGDWDLTDKKTIDNMMGGGDQSGSQQQKQGAETKDDDPQNPRPSYEMISLSNKEEQLIQLIRSCHIDVEELCTIAQDLVEKNDFQLPAEPETIYVNSDDDSSDTEGLKAGIKYSNLNKQIMVLIKSYAGPHNLPLLINILKLLVEDRSIIYRDLIMGLIDSECKKLEANENVAKTVDPNVKHAKNDAEVSKATITVGVNTDLSGDVVKLPSPKRKTLKVRQELAPIINRSDINPRDPWIPQEEITQTQHQSRDKTDLQKEYDSEIQQQCQQYNQQQYVETMNYPQSAVYNIPSIQCQETLMNRPIINPIQAVNPIRPIYHQQHGSFANCLQPTNPMQQMQPLKDFQHVPSYEEHPLSLVKRVPKPQSCMQLPLKKQPSNAARLPSVQSLPVSNQYQQCTSHNFPIQQRPNAGSSMQYSVMQSYDTTAHTLCTPFQQMAQINYFNQNTHQASLPDYSAAHTRRWEKVDPKSAQSRLEPLLQTTSVNPENTPPVNIPQVNLNSMPQSFGNNPLQPLQETGNPQRYYQPHGWNAQMYSYPNNTRALNPRMYSNTRYQ